jgi:hypothetical protein
MTAKNISRFCRQSSRRPLHRGSLLSLVVVVVGNERDYKPEFFHCLFKLRKAGLQGKKLPIDEANY